VSDRRRTFTSGQWALAGLLVVGVSFLVFSMGLNLVGFAFMLLVTLAVVFFVRRTGSR
jgi:hypothetical protein